MRLQRRVIDSNPYIDDATSGLYPMASFDPQALTTLTDPTPLTPQNGDRYLVGTGGVGAWLTRDGLTAEWDGANWLFWEDVNGIESWHNWGERVGCDFLYIKDRIKKILIDTGTGATDIDKEIDGFANATPAEQYIATLYLRGSHTQRKTVLGNDMGALTLIAASYHQNAVECRSTRLAMAQITIYNALPNNINDTRMDIAGGLLVDYTTMGIETKAEHGRDGLVDYLHGTAGTGWEGTGLLQKGWTPDGYTDIQELVDKVQDIVLSGIYGGLIQ